MRQGIRTWGNSRRRLRHHADRHLRPARARWARGSSDVLPPTVFVLRRPTSELLPLVDVLAAEISGDGIGSGQPARPAPRRARRSRPSGTGPIAGAPRRPGLRTGDDDVADERCELLHEQPGRARGRWPRWRSAVGRLARRPGAAVRAGGRRAADGVPHRVAARAGRRPTARHRRHGRRACREVGYTSPFTFSTAFKRGTARARWPGAAPRPVRSRRADSGQPEPGPQRPADPTGGAVGGDVGVRAVARRPAEVDHQHVVGRAQPVDRRPGLRVPVDVTAEHGTGPVPRWTSRPRRGGRPRGGR